MGRGRQRDLHRFTRSRPSAGRGREQSRGRWLGTFKASLAAPAGDLTNPTAKVGVLAEIDDQSRGDKFSEFLIDYTDETAIDLTTLDLKDVRVTGPGGYNALATLNRSTPSADGKTVAAYYRLTPPGGTWDAADSGKYIVTLEASQVADKAGNFADAGTLGTFTATLTVPPVGPKVELVGYPQFAAGSGPGTPGRVQFYGSDAVPRLVDPLAPFGDFTGGVRIASADFNKDGIADLVAGTGPGRATRIVVYRRPDLRRVVHRRPVRGRRSSAASTSPPAT